MVNERAFRFGRSNHLIGIITFPAMSTPVRPTGLILVNAGLLYRVGPYRLHVRLARRLAELGFACLRLDLSGIGDSATGEATDLSRAIVDVQDAIGLLQRESGAVSAAVFGACSGAVCAFEAALSDERIKTLILVDGYIYPTWKTRPHYYLRRLKEGVDWISVLRRKMTFQRRPIAEHVEQGLTFETGSLPAEDYARGLTQILSRGGRIAQHISGGFPDIYNYSEQFADGFPQWASGSKVTATYYPQADHLFTSQKEQRKLVDNICDGLNESITFL